MLRQRPVVRRRRPIAAPARRTRVAAPRPKQRPPARLDVDALATRWQRAFDASQIALAAARVSLPGHELGARADRLREDLDVTEGALAGLARAARVRAVPWLSPVPVTPKLLGLPATVKACVFDVGVLTNSAALHATAWAAVFDDLLLRLAERTGRHFIPFDREADYAAYLEGRPRLDGIHAFLGARGIRIPEGRVDDPASAETAHGLARRKNEALARGLHDRGVTAAAGARRYLEAAGRAGLVRGVVSASANSARMLELAELSRLLEVRVDADVARAEGLRSRPAPDMILAACRRLGVAPADAAAFTTTPAGVAAARAAGLLVLGVGEDAREELLAGVGADRTARSLRLLLAPRLRLHRP